MWTAARLRRLRAALAAGESPAYIAQHEFGPMSVNAAAIDRAAWVLLGRTPEEAAAILNSGFIAARDAGAPNKRPAVG